MSSLDGLLGSIQSSALKDIVRHWDAARGDAILPSFESLQLSALSGPVNRMWVYRYDGQSKRFTGRLSGDQITKAFGKNFSNLPLEEAMTASDYLWVHRYLTRVVTEPAIYRSGGNLYRQAGRLIAGERIALPLADDGLTCDGVLGISDYRDPHLDGPFELITEQEIWLSLRWWVAGGRHDAYRKSPPAED
ncbi:MAG: PAS domain-containing protein [Rhizomicrobium sp.]